MQPIKKKLTDPEIQQIQLNLLDTIDAFCRKHGIRYSLAYGTLIGAVRHKGFIPWDDDIDLLMPRPDYDRFIREFKSEENEVLNLSAKDACVETFAKVSRKNTVMVDRELGRSLWGVNVDIFPIDGAPKEGLQERFNEMEKKRAWIFRLCPFYKVVTKGRVKWFLKYCLKRLRYPSLSGCVGVKQAIENELRSCVFGETALAGAYFGDDGIREFMPTEWFTEFTTLPFEGKSYPVLTHYHDYLTRLFGDYMQLPPEEQRVSHHLYDTYLLENE